MKHIKGVIFDLDGTLVSCTLCFKTMREAINCPPDEDILAYVDSLSSNSKTEANRIINQMELDEASSAIAITGAIDFIAHLNQLDIPIAILTRNNARAAKIKCINNNLHIDTVITRDDAPAKPNPQGIFDIANNWQLPLDSLLYIGDYLHDIQIAENAGIESALYCDSTKPTPSFANQATYVFNHYQEFAKNF